MRMTLQNRRDEERLQQAADTAVPVPLLVELDGRLVSSDIGLECLAANLSAGRFGAAWAHMAGQAR